jgi:hypothetical protein
MRARPEEERPHAEAQGRRAKISTSLRLCVRLSFALALALALGAQALAAEPALERARRIVDEVRAASYPELAGVDVELRAFSSKGDFFQCRPDLRRFLLGGRMRYIVFVNPRVFDLDAPETGVRAIVAHELGHAVYYRRRNRLELLGLVRLGSSGYRGRFERWADLQAISRGYGEGLKAYRAWLYRTIPSSKLAEKRRDYYTPEEIDAILAAAAADPRRYEDWMRRVPRTLAEITAAPARPAP